LTSLYEKPMHPYEISQTLRERGVDRSVRLNFGSLYSVVEGLEKRGLIQGGEKIREGRRPERTVYEITEAGTTEMTDWLVELVSIPVKEYLQFEAGLALLGAIHPDEVVGLLRQRVAAMESTIEQDTAEVTDIIRRGLPRLFLLEAEYQTALQQAEVQWVRQLIADIESGRLGDLEQWRAWHETGQHIWDIEFDTTGLPGFDKTENNKGQEDNR
jgi:DNA-binding PadR family transcriptional regulator